MLRIVCRLIPLVLLSLFAISCADAAKHLRAQPAWFLEPTSAKPLLVSLPPIDKEGTPIGEAAEIDNVAIKCVRTPRSENVSPTEGAAISQCLYMSIDMRDVLKVPIRNAAERNRLVHLLVNVSDYNCSTFLMRAFAHKAGTEATRNTAKDVATAIAAGTARVAGAFSSGLGIVNLVGGTAIDNVNTSYYADKTFQVMAAAIGAERDKTRTVLLNHSKVSVSLADYSFFEALEDVHEYDDSCSLRRGLESLAAAANNEKERTAGALRAKRGDETPADTAKKPAVVVAADVSANQQ